MSAFFKNQNGLVRIVPLLLIVAAVGVISFLLVSSSATFNGLFGTLNPKPASQAAALVSIYPTIPTPQRTFFVSPTGNDNNPGTQSSPWATFFKAASTLQAGDMAVFADGVYNETQYRPNTAFANSGTGTPGQSNFHPIVVKAQNKRRAILNFQNIANATPVWIINRNNIVIQDFEITKPTLSGSNYGGTDSPTNYGDGLVRCWPTSSNCWLLGNWLHNAVEPVKTSGAPFAIFAGNLVTHSVTGFGSVGGDNPTINNNEFYDIRDEALQTKGGTSSARIYNNYIHTVGTSTLNIGMYVGGNGDASYNNVAFNNVIVSATAGKLNIGIVMQGCWNCAVYNNVIVGANAAFQTFKGDPGSQSPTITDYLYTNNPIWKNNIATDCTYGAVLDPTYTIGTINFDFNDFTCSSNIPSQAHVISGDPKFVNKLTDWHLQAGSPAIGAGTTTSFATKDGSNVDTAFDYGGNSRITPWDLGVYNQAIVSSPGPSPSLIPSPSPVQNITYNFEDGTTQGWGAGGATGSATLDNSQIAANDGTHSLIVTLTGVSQSNWGSAFVTSPPGLIVGKTITAKVLVPTGGTNGLQSSIFVQGVPWSEEQPAVNLTPGIWASLSYVVPAGTVLNAPYYLGVRLYPADSTTTLSGTAFIDTVNIGATISSPTPVPTPTLSPTPVPTPTRTPTPVPTPTRTPSPTPVPTPTPNPCPRGPLGDANCDGFIDIFDYSLVITHFGQLGTNIPGDVNKDGAVDIFDYSLVVTHFGQ